jgi:hypothetical protein
LVDVTFFDYLQSLLKKDKSHEQALAFFKKHDDFRNFDSFMICKYLYQGNMMQWANYFQKYVYVLKKEEMFKLIYFNLPRNNVFIKYTKKVKEEKKEIIDYLKDYYQISQEKAKDYLDILSEDDLEDFLSMYGMDAKKIQKVLNG